MKLEHLRKLQKAACQNEYYETNKSRKPPGVDAVILRYKINCPRTKGAASAIAQMILIAINERGQATISEIHDRCLNIGYLYSRSEIATKVSTLLVKEAVAAHEIAGSKYKTYSLLKATVEKITEAA